MKRIFYILFFIGTAGFAQNTVLSIDSCLLMAKRNYPLVKQNKWIEESERNALSSTNKSWLPKLSFIAKASYQSEVVEFAGLSFPKDNYLSAVDLEQTLFDAGQIKQQRKLEKLSSDNERAKNQVELYKLIDRINQLYSSILLTRANLATLTLYEEDIKNKKSILSASVTNGLALSSSLNELEAEEMKTEESQIEAKENLSALYQSLGMFINISMNDSTKLSTETSLLSGGTDFISRPEIKLFNTQKRMLDERNRLIGKTVLPKVTLSAEGAYGRPGPNFLNQDLRFFGTGAINLKWNVGSLYSFSNEKESNVITKKMLDIQQETFELNQRTALLNQTAQINSLKSMLEKDKLILQKRHAIRTTASVQLDNGSITTNDYLIQLNAEMQAILTEKMHEIKLMNAITTYNTTKGINNY